MTDLTCDSWKYEIWNPDEEVEDLGYAELDIEEVEFFDFNFIGKTINKG